MNDHDLTTRRTAIAGIAGLAASLLALPGPTGAQSGTPLRIVVGFPAGGGGDLLARALAERLKDELQRPVLVDNRPGAGGMIAAQSVRSQPNDGATVMMVNDHMVVTVPLTMKAAGYTMADFMPVAEVAIFRHAFTVGPGQPPDISLGSWLQRAKAEPRAAAYGVPAPGSQAQFVGWVLGQTAGAPLTMVPYRGGAPLNADLMGGQVPASVDALGNVAEAHRQKKLRILAVTGQQRSPLLPEVPTFAELGFGGLDRDGWTGFVAPPGTPDALLRDLDRALQRVLAQPELVGRLSAMGFEVRHAPAAALVDRARRDTAYWSEVIQRSGFQTQ